MDNDKLKDINVWKRITRHGDPKALSILFRKYYKALLNYGLHLKPRKQLVQDSIQELFYKIWNKRDRLDEVDNVPAYLYSAMRRILFRQADLQQNRHERDQAYSDEKLSKSVINIERRIISEEIKKEEKKKLREAIETLSDRQREAALLKFYGGLTNDEISEVMNVNKQSVYNYIYRAIGALQKEMDISLSA